MSENQPWYAPNRRIGIPRLRVPGFKLWELHDGGVHVATCELRDDEQGGAGIDVQLLEDDEILLSKRCLTREAAEYVAEAFKQDYVRQGWLDVTKKTTDAS
jgi:hypothetical protein